MMGRILTLATTVVVGLGVVTGGLFAAGVIGVPDAGVEDNDWGTVTNDSIEVVTTVWVDNPNPVGVGTGGTAGYALELGGVRLATGQTDQLSVGSGNTTTTISTQVRRNRIPDWWAAHIRNNETSPLAATVTANVSAGPFSGSPSGTYSDSLQTDIDGSLTDAMSSFEGEYTGTRSTVGRGPGGVAIQPTVEITDTNASWGAVTENRTEIHTTFTVFNPNAYPIPTPAFAGSMALNNVTLGAWEASEVDILNQPTDAQIPPQQSKPVTFVVDADNENVTEWLPTHIQRGEFSKVTITGSLAMQISGSEVQLPRDQEAIRCQYDMQTAIFVDNQTSSTDRQSCSPTPWLFSSEAIERGGGSLDLTETEWWQSGTLTGPGIVDTGGNSDGDDSNEQTDSTGDSDGGNDDADDGEDGIGLPTTSRDAPETHAVSSSRCAGSCSHHGVSTDL
jgi:LEA14-like dessication related protein